MKINFLINNDLIVSSALASERGHKLNGWTDLKNKLWSNHKDAYSFLLDKKKYKFFAFDDWTNRLNKMSGKLRDLFDDCIASEEFSAILHNTNEYKNWLQNEWNENSNNILKQTKNILKTDLPDEMNLVLVDPQIGGGSYLGDNTIFWGHKEDWPNYNVVYIMHETMHSMLGTSKIEHAVIELATDNELRIRLNNGGEYFVCNGKKVGHDFLRDLEERLLPAWKNYLISGKDIYEFIKESK